MARKLHHHHPRPEIMDKFISPCFTSLLHMSCCMFSEQTKGNSAHNSYLNRKSHTLIALLNLCNSWYVCSSYFWTLKNLQYCRSFSSAVRVLHIVNGGHLNHHAVWDHLKMIDHIVNGGHLNRHAFLGQLKIINTTSSAPLRGASF